MYIAAVVWVVFDHWVLVRQVDFAFVILLPRSRPFKNLCNEYNTMSDSISFQFSVYDEFKSFSSSY